MNNTFFEFAFHFLTEKKKKNSLNHATFIFTKNISYTDTEEKDEILFQNNKIIWNINLNKD